jgi:hypothetical protein
MKNYLSLICLIISCLTYSCGKSSEPAPVTPTKPVIEKPTDPTTPTNPSGGTGTTPTNPATGNTIERIDINTQGGNSSGDSTGLKTIELSNGGNNKGVKLGPGGDVKTSLMNASTAIVVNDRGVLRASFPEYSETDTLKQPYMRIIKTDGTKITEYRVYIKGKDAFLDYIAWVLPKAESTADFIKRYNSSTMKILIANR